VIPSPETQIEIRQRMGDELADVALQLLAYCERNNWRGYDPYDALNSPLLQSLRFLNVKMVRQALMHALKLSPINIRPLLLVPPTRNPKALGLFLAARLKLSTLGLLNGKNPASGVFEALVSSRAPNSRYWSWGYSFPWQTRAEFVPRGAPNLVCTVFVAEALSDAHEAGVGSDPLDMAVSAADYLLDELYWSDGNSVAGFAYPLPSMRQQVHNANFLAAALLYRVGLLSGQERFFEPAFRVARFSASRQRPDGSWLYGEMPHQGWIDNFHTGYNLCALRRLGRFARTEEFEPFVSRGFKFYHAHFFRPDGAPRYFHDRPYPIDSHCVAQSVITLCECHELNRDNLDRAHAALQWAIRNMWDERGYFYYRKHALGTNRISYMRWSQAWMLLALATLLAHEGAANRRDQEAVPSGAKIPSPVSKDPYIAEPLDQQEI
jgi:hypothetical protein